VKGVRSLSAVALARLGDARSIPLLLATLDDPEADTFSRSESIRLLGKLKVVEARDRILALLNEPGLGPAVASALADFEAFDELLIAAQAGNVTAIGFLGSLGDRRAVEPLMQMLSNAPEGRIEVVKALGELGDARAAEPLLEVFRELRSSLREAKPDHYGFMPAWVASSKRELAEVVASLGKLRDKRAHEPIGNLLLDERLFAERAISSARSSCLYGSIDVLKRCVRAIAEFGDGDDFSSIHLLIAVMERGQSACVDWPAGGWEWRREFQQVLDAAETSFEILQRRMAARQAEEDAVATAAASDLSISMVIFRAGPAPADGGRYCQQVFDSQHDGRTLGQWRIIGVQEPIAPSDAASLYRSMVVEGRLPYFGHACGELEGSGPDGAALVALFFSRQEIGPAEDTLEAVETVSAGDLDRIAAYWRDMATVWWRDQEATRTSAICDDCNSTVARGQGFLNGSSLFCERCCEDRLSSEALERLREDPNYFGTGLLEAARARANPAGGR
jgi:HEAT repeat protein